MLRIEVEGFSRISGARSVMSVYIGLPEKKYR